MHNIITMIVITGATLDSPPGVRAQRNSRTGILNSHIHVPRGHDRVQSSSGLPRPRMGDGERPGAMQRRQNGGRT